MSPSPPRSICTIVLPVVGMLTLVMLLAPPPINAGLLSAFHPGHHKRISVTLLDGAGSDYPCDDSDGPDSTSACQIHCVTAPCMEPYRLCLAHDECTAIAVNADLSFATLKSQLYVKAAASAAPCTSLADWQRWWGSRTRARLPGARRWHRA